MDASGATAGVALKAAQLIGREESALRRFMGKSERKRLLDKVRERVEGDADIPHDHRQEVGATIKRLGLEPSIYGILYLYLEEGKDAALEGLPAELERLLPAAMSPADRKATATRITALVRKVAPEAFRSHEEAERFDHLRTRDAVRSDGEQTRSQLGTIKELIEQQQKPPPIVLVPIWAPETQQKMLKELAAVDAALAGWIGGELDSSDVQAAGRKAAGLIDSSESRLEEGPAVLWVLLASTAQKAGNWEQASRGWMEASTRFAEAGDRKRQVNTLLSAAVALSMAGDPEGHRTLIEQARDLDPRNPRIAMEDVGRLDDAAERLARLEEVEPEDDLERTALHLNRGLTHLMQLDTDGAERELDKALKVSGETVQTRLLRINITVQRGQEAISFGKPIDGRGLRKAQRDALDLRDELLRERRYEDALRTLMLATDAQMLDRGPQAGKELLQKATPGEREWPEGAEILGEAALRAQEPRLALSLTDDAPDAPNIRRIRAMARVKDRGGSLESKLEACAELDAVLEQPDLLGLHAAASRCLACMFEPALPWNEAVNERLKETYFEEWGNGLHAVHTAQSKGLAAADALIDKAKFSPPLRAEVRFQVAVEAGAKEEAAKRAGELRKHGTDQTMESLCAIAYFDAEDLEEAGILAAALAEDPNAPDSVRKEMFRLGCKVAELDEDWARATEIVGKGLDSFPGDNWLNSFRARAAARN